MSILFMKNNENSMMRNFVIVVFVSAIALMAIIAITGCSVVYKKGDLKTVEFTEATRDRYVQDIKLAGKVDLESEMIEGDFPIGSLTWIDYITTLDGYKFHLKYEQDKLDEESEDSDVDVETTENED